MVVVPVPLPQLCVEHSNLYKHGYTIFEILVYDFSFHVKLAAAEKVTTTTKSDFNSQNIFELFLIKQ